jgi:hypothetical protein
MQLEFGVKDGPGEQEKRRSQGDERDTQLWMLEIIKVILA